MLGSIVCSSTLKALEEVLLFTARRMAKFSYKPRLFRNKGALLALFWSFSAFLVASYLLSGKGDIEYLFALSMLICPFAGWLADVYFGRYKVICWSMRLLWSCVVMYTILLCLKDYTSISDKHYRVIQNPIVAMGLVGLGGVQANTIQFGLDQLTDASSRDMSSYISWFVLIYFLSDVFILYSQECICGAYSRAVAFLVVPVLFMTLSVVSDMLFNHLLVKEPVSHNPLKLIVQVLKYAWKNKYPCLRSAFTYWDDKLFSRIDLGKTKFGGPFTTEQVEDVKTFFRFILIIFISVVLIGLIYNLDVDIAVIMSHYQNGKYPYQCPKSNCLVHRSWNCYERQTVRVFGHIVTVIFIFVLEFVLYPLLWKCNPIAKINIKQKFLLGMFAFILYEIFLLSLEVAGALQSQDHHNITCVLLPDDKSQGIDLDYKWLALSGIFHCFGMYLMWTSGLEFLYAQAPYSMKGFLTGIFFGTFVISVAFWYGVWCGLLPLTKTEAVKHVILGCGVWYFISVVVVSTAVVFIACVIVKWYSFRRRDENMQNEQIFAVNYFEKCSTSVD